MIDETRARFIAAIAKQVPAERVIETHFFPGIRQGGMESGVAVLALERVQPLATETPVAEAAIEEPDVQDAASTEAELSADEAVDDGIDAAQDVVETQEESVVSDDEQGEVVAAMPASRYTVYTARYRHTLKGIDRGKWEVNVKEEADAPLLTIDAVVRGVQRRSGDVDDAIRLSGDEFRAALPTVAA